MFESEKNSILRKVKLNMSSGESGFSEVEKLQFLRQGVMARLRKAVILKIYRISKTNRVMSKGYKSLLKGLPLA